MPRGVIVKAGKLNKQVTIKTPPGATASQNAYGEPGAAAGTLASNVWCSIDPVGGDETFEGLQVIAKATHKIQLRYLAGVTPGCHVVFGSRTFYVGLIQNAQEDNWLLTLVCEEKVTP